MVFSEGYEMALYPHLPSPTGSIPWQDLGTASRALFRLRGVQEWEAKVGKRETMHIEENMESLSLISLSADGKTESAGEGLSGLSEGESRKDKKIIAK